jgi:hypothetical protein
VTGIPNTPKPVNVFLRTDARGADQVHASRSPGCARGFQNARTPDRSRESLAVVTPRTKR